MKRLSQFLLALLVSFLPVLAQAQSVLKPKDGNTWDMYVYGNGMVIQKVMNGVSLLMVGDGSFINLLTTMGVLGFLVLAIGAGFDPGKNLLRMFTYIFVVWFVAYGSTRLTANVNIIDLVAEASATSTDQEYFLAEKVPALVALPAVFTSQVGNHFASSIETFFSSVVPAFEPAFGMSTGQFNLFNRMIEESSQYSFKSQELKRSLTSYVTDCTVPALARGWLTGPDGEKGVDALFKSKDLMGTFESAKHNTILTTYYPLDDTSKDKLPTSSLVGIDRNNITAQGVVLSCSDAYDIMKNDMEREAQELLDASNEAWAKSGVMVTYETAMTSALSQAAACRPGGAGCAHGYILQQALIGAKSGAFRAAAVQTGNNEMLTAANLAQAEQSQKSTWVAGFAIFNNMMGYVFTVLQSFIFALTPLIIVALMVPGMGKSIFVNYAQVLVWLTLWPPMFAIVNFIITIYGSTEFAEAIGAGLTANNSALVVERAKNSVIAAQFLGTSVPLLTWGIVKGAMAFTEFISSGVGSQFASQAGASAATGNMSMNNMSMNNTSMNKFDTVSSTAVGTQGVTVSQGVGAMNSKFDLGGMSTSVNGSAVERSTSMQQSAQRSLSTNTQVQSAISDMMSKGYNESQLKEIAAGNARSSSEVMAAQRVLSKMASAGSSDSAGTSNTTAQMANDSTSTSRNSSTGKSDHIGTSAQAGLGVDVGAIGNAVAKAVGVGGEGKGKGPFNAKLGGEAETGTQINQGTTMGQSRATGTTTTGGTATTAEQGKLSASNTVSAGDTASKSNSADKSNSANERFADSKGAALQKAYSDALSETVAHSVALSRGLSAMQSSGYKEGVNPQIFSDMQNAITAIDSQLVPSMQALEERQRQMSEKLTTRGSGTQNLVEATADSNLHSLTAAQGKVAKAPVAKVTEEGVAETIKQHKSDITKTHSTVETTTGVVQGIHKEEVETTSLTGNMLTQGRTDVRLETAPNGKVMDTGQETKSALDKVKSAF